MTSLPSLLAQHPEWSIVLSAYAGAEQALPPRPKRTGGAATAGSPDGLPAEDDASAVEQSGESSSPDEATPAETEEDSRWIPRLGEVEGVAADQLSRVHGRLIAEGLLRFNLLGRTDGIGYRLTPAGRQAVEIAERAGTGSQDAAA